MKVKPVAEGDVVLQGFLDFGYFTPEGLDRIGFTIVRRAKGYAFCTNYRHLGECLIPNQEKALSFIHRFETTCHPITHQPSNHLVLTELKSTFLKDLIEFDDSSFRASHVVMAIAEAELILMVRGAYKKFSDSSEIQYTKAEKDTLYSAGFLLGIEQLRIPTDSVLHKNIDDIKGQNDQYFYRGYREGMLFHSPMPDVDITAKEILELSQRIAVESQREFELAVRKGAAQYYYPQDGLSELDVPALLGRIQDCLPMAVDCCDGTNPDSLVNEEYGTDLVEQYRDELIRRGYVFSREQLEELEFLNWPLSHVEAEVVARSQLGSDFISNWNDKKNKLLYGTEVPRAAEEKRLLNIFNSLFRGDCSAYQAQDVSISISRATNHCHQINKQTLLTLKELLKTYSVERTFSFNVTDLKPHSTIASELENVNAYLELDSSALWSIHCVPTQDSRFWSALVELHRVSKQPIEVSATDNRTSEIWIVVKEGKEGPFELAY